MRKNTLTAIMGALVLMTVVPAARAEIASRAYVDDKLETKMNTMTIDSAPTANSTNLVTSDGVATAIANAVANTVPKTLFADDILENAPFDRILMIGKNPETGDPVIALEDDHGIDSEHMAEGAISISRIKMPTLPSECRTNGGSCVLVAKGGANGYVTFVWEIIGRDTNETLPTFGAISPYDYNTNGIAPMFSQE